MTVIAISKTAAITKVLDALHMPLLAVTGEISPQVVAQALRRAAHILAPCPRHELETSVLRSLGPLSSIVDGLAATITEVLDSLLAYGDIIEMRVPTDAPWALGSLVIRPAPPSFVAMKSGTVIILGVAGDDITPLSGELDKRIEWRGVLRMLVPDRAEDFRVLLTDLGLIELSERAWLRLPPVGTADVFRATWDQRLNDAPPASAIEGLQILDGRMSPTYYQGRWTIPSRDHSGFYVARRTQRYGAPLWCLVNLVGGVAARFLDLTARMAPERPCDLAWRIQMALDAVAGKPQTYRSRSFELQSRLDFFSPIPSWAERKLAVDGQRITPERCLFSYVMPSERRDDVVAFLRSHLWAEPEAHLNKEPP